MFCGVPIPNWKLIYLNYQNILCLIKNKYIILQCFNTRQRYNTPNAKNNLICSLFRSGHNSAPSLWSWSVFLCLHTPVCPFLGEMQWTGGLRRWIGWNGLSSQPSSSALRWNGVPVLYPRVYPIPPAVWRSAWLPLKWRWIQLLWVISLA